MALIPSDVGIRMRMQNEASLLQQVAPVHEIPSDVLDMRPGQQFSARIQEVLPDNTYKALVAGKQLTLQLPEGAKAGDELELVVVDRTVRSLIARMVDGKAAAGTAQAVPYEFAKFSPAARMIVQLLPAEGKAAAPAALNGGAPLIAQPPATQGAATELAPTLARAVAQSGLFYEAHQAQWVAGKLPLEQLLLEPQGKLSAPAAFQQAAAETAARAISTAERPVTPATIMQALQGGNEKVGAGGTASASAANPVQRMPDELRPLVQQQLEAAGTQRMFWHGEVWPQQAMDWQIEWQGERDGDGSGAEDARWATSLSLTTPRLGRVDAHLRLSAKGVRIALATSSAAGAADLRAAAPQLAGALEAAGVPLVDLRVRQEDEHAAGQ